MYKDLLPIGSVVLLKGGQTKVMICGRVITNGGTEIYDYVGCPFPYGVMASDGMIFFNRKSIERVYFVGFQDPEEMNFRENVLDQLGELEVVDGKIVSKTKE